MQLRKVCNHPNLFDPRPTVCPFTDTSIEYCIPSLIHSIQEYDPFVKIDLKTLNLVFSDLSKMLADYDYKTISSSKYTLRTNLENLNNSEVYVRLKNYNGFHRYLRNSNFQNINGNKSSVNSPIFIQNGSIPNQFPRSENKGNFECTL